MTRSRLLVTLFRERYSHRCYYVAGLGSGVAHASDRGGGDCFLDISGCSSVRVCPLDGIGSCLPTSVRLTVVTELSEVMVQATARVNERFHTLFE